MTNSSKLLSVESKSECNRTLEEGQITNMKERENYENIQRLNFGYMQHLEIIFGTQLAA